MRTGGGGGEKQPGGRGPAEERERPEQGQGTKEARRQWLE